MHWVTATVLLSVREDAEAGASASEYARMQASKQACMHVWGAGAALAIVATGVLEVLVTSERD
jgi:hypothetical protein